MRTGGTEDGRVAVYLLLVLLASVLAVPALAARSSGTTNAELSSSEFRGHPPSSSGFDEQIGLTFTQNFTSMAYNVTAAQQTDPTLGLGPGYLLSGLSNSGYWYQVGLSWDWSEGAGFAMSYEVFNPSGQSIDPINEGGLTGFSGPINPGDNVTITLYFSFGDVIMAATDANTGASARQSYPAEGATQFVGQPNSDANSVGFFTGLMTEWYHGEPYYTNEAEVLYTTDSALSSGWMWMDEFNAGNGQLVFESNATSVTTYGAGVSQLQEFSYQGITEYSSDTAFVTGALSGSSTSTSSGSSTVTSTVTSTDTATIVSAVTQTVTTVVPTTVTVTSTSTVTQPVTSTVTTQPSTVTTTSTVPTTQTLTQEQTTTATQTLTTTISSIPIWVYGLMGLILLAGLALGYLIRRPAPAETPTQ